MRRPPLSFFVAGLVLVLGLAGLVRGSIPQSSASGTAAASGGPGIVVGNAYVREPANGVNAAAYLTIYNTTNAADELLSVVSGAGAQTTLHTDSNGSMAAMSGLSVPAKGSVTLSPGKGHIMIEKLYGPVKAGQTVNLQLTFATAGEVLVTAPVIGILAPAPGTSGAASASAAGSSATATGSK